MKIVNFLLAIMFLLFAFVQINDPDPVVWILIYGSLAVICVMAMFEVYKQRVLLALLVALLGYSIFFMKGVGEWLRQENKGDLFDDVAKMQHLYIEESREFLGLMICVLVLAMHLYHARKKVN